MNAIKVNYIQTGKVLLVRPLGKFRELFLEMPPKSVFREPKNAKEENDYLGRCVPRATRRSVCHKVGLQNFWRMAKFD